MNLAGFRRASDLALAVGAPLVLAFVELFHPHAGDLLQFDVPRWLWVHYAQILLFPLAALAVTRLVRGHADVAARLCRAAMFLFAASYIAFDTAAGVVTGILVDAARASGSPESWRAPIEAVWTHPIVGGSSQVAAPFLAIAGSVLLSIGAISAAVSLKRNGNSWPPVTLLAAASFGIAIFHSHAWPGGPVTFGGIAIAAAWIYYERSRLMAPHV